MALRSPLQDATIEAGAVLAESAGWSMPVRYADAGAEYRAAREGTALFDVSHRGKLLITGADAFRFLHNLCTNDVNRLIPGTGCEAFLTTGQAKIVAHVLIYRTAQTLWLDVAPGQAEKALKHLQHYHVTEDIEISDRTTAYAQLHVAGPHAPGLLKGLLNGEVPLQRLDHIEQTAAAGIAWQLRNHDPLGVGGFDVVCPNEQARPLWQMLLDAGARPAGLEAYEVLRIEAGTPEYGRDIDETNLPQEVGRTDQAVSFTKGCYIGQETVARIRTYGHVNRTLVGLRVNGQTPITAGTRLLRDGKEIGYVASSVLSSRLGAIVGLGYVRRGNEATGTLLTAEGHEGPIEVVRMPL